MGCLGALFGFFGAVPTDEAGVAEVDATLPYRTRDDFLSPAELSFFHVLQRAVDGQFYVCAKVRIADLLFVTDRRKNIAHANRIDRKHVDFVLCDLKSMEPRLVVELDDASHQKKDRQTRDEFVDSAFEAAGLSILHVKCKQSYSIEDLKRSLHTATASTPETAAPIAPPPLPDNSTQTEIPLCSKCGISMVARKAAKGKHAGKRFWACSNYPQCKVIVPID